MLMIDEANVDKLIERARREVDDGLLPSAQIALAHDGKIVVEEAFGDASVDSRYSIFSATKPIVASVIWILMAEGAVDVNRPVIDYFPQFAGRQQRQLTKASITVEQVMLHTAGFPHAPLSPADWMDRSRRVETMADWKLDWEPGSRYEYHATSAHWVLAEIIDQVTGDDYRNIVERWVTGPAGLPRVLGINSDDQNDIADLVAVGDPSTPAEREAVFGTAELPATEVTEELILRFNEPELRQAGVPGAGGVARARDVALFYQELLHNPNGIWDDEILADATGRIRNDLPDPAGVPAGRSLGLTMAGDDGTANLRGHGRTVSPAAFGHNGIGGQLAWADPATGLSLGYLTNGVDRHEIRQARRGTALSSIAGTCASPT